MKNLRREKRAVIAMAAVGMLLVSGLSVPQSLAYFTTYVTAEGGYTLHLGSTNTEIQEDYYEGSKHIQIENQGEKDCYVRAKAFGGQMVTLSYSGEGWMEGADGYWYYSEIVPAGGMTKELVVTIQPKDGLKQDYDVIVVQECAPVLYDENGTAYGCSADNVWSQAFETESEATQQ
jgi:hypothetical protein